MNPNYAKAYYNRGVAYDELNERERAIEDFDKAIELNPNFVEAYYNRGTAYDKLKQHERAIEDYDKAIELNPNDAEAYHNRGLAYDKLNQHVRAIEDYDNAIELNPNDAEAYYNRGLAYGNRGIAYSKIGRYEESARDFKKAGILFFHSRREEDAVKVFFICFELQDKIENDDIVYCGLTLFLITLNPDVIIALRKMQAQDETLRELLELTMRKLHNEDISEEIAVLEREEEREEMKILLELLKRS